MLFFVFWFFLIQVFKERPLSLSWVPGDVALVARLSSNRRFFNEMVLYREWVREVEQPRQGQRGKRENTKSKSNERTAAHFLADFFAVIERLTLSNLIGVVACSAGVFHERAIFALAPTVRVTISTLPYLPLS